MIVYKNKQFTQIGLYPDTDWIGDADWVIPDDSELAKKNIRLYPNFEFVFDDDGKPVDVTETEPEPAPEPVPTDHERLEAMEQAFMEFVSEVM